jgi:general secretion pathway protein A
VLVVNKAQEILPVVLAELRLLSSVRLDSHILLTIVLLGDGRLLERPWAKVASSPPRLISIGYAR